MSTLSDLVTAAERVSRAWLEGSNALPQAINDLTTLTAEARNGADPEVQRLVEEAWLSRAKEQEFGKPSTVTYRRKEAEFFMGAMAALNAVLPNPDKTKLGTLAPPVWFWNLIANKNIVEP